MFNSWLFGQQHILSRLILDNNTYFVKMFISWLILDNNTYFVNMFISWLILDNNTYFIKIIFLHWFWTTIHTCKDIYFFTDSGQQYILCKDVYLFLALILGQQQYILCEVGYFLTDSGQQYILCKYVYFFTDSGQQYILCKGLFLDWLTNFVKIFFYWFWTTIHTL